MPPLTAPTAGQVVHYSYLWLHERLRGLEEGTKDRPCLIVTAETIAGITLVTVLPITHTPPPAAAAATPLPAELKRRLGLDDHPSWIITNEANQFAWPGYDLRTIPGTKPPRRVYGVIGPGLLARVRERLLANSERGQLAVTPR